MNDIIAGYRFDDLKRARLVSSRGDLHEKQRKYGFPKPVKIGARVAWWPRDEVHAWIKKRTALRDKSGSADGDSAASAPAKQKPKQQRTRAREVA